MGPSFDYEEDDEDFYGEESAFGYEEEDDGMDDFGPHEGGTGHGHGPMMGGRGGSRGGLGAGRERHPGHGMGSGFPGMTGGPSRHVGMPGGGRGAGRGRGGGRHYPPGPDGRIHGVHWDEEITERAMRDHIQIRREQGKRPWLSMDDVGKLGMEIQRKEDAVKDMERREQGGRR